MKDHDYNDINITDIILEADISRSTFYAHFKKKDEILIKYLDEMMSHVFEHLEGNNKDILTHVFEHIKEEREEMRLILDSSASHLFRKELRKKLNVIVSSCYVEGLYGHKDIPTDLARHQYLNDLIALIQYYVHHGQDISPNDLTEYYFKLFN